jgi:hypothetical protein
VSVRIERRGRRRWADLNSFTRRYAAGAGSLSFSTHPLRAGRYRAVVRAQDGAHNRSRRVARRFRLN